MMLLVVLIIVISVILFAILFLYLHHVYKQLKIRHKRPPGLEHRPELAFVLAHGVEAYNEQRRLRRMQERSQTQATSGSNDSASIQSAITDISEPLPAYTTNTYRITPGSSAIPVSPSTSTAMHPLDNSAPPMYIYQPPSTRSAVQAALLTSDNSPSISTPSGSAQPDLAGDNRSSQRRSVVSGILPRSMRRANQRESSFASSLSSSSSTADNSNPAVSSPQLENQTLEDPLSSRYVAIEQVASGIPLPVVTPPSDATTIEGLASTGGAEGQ
ncbi:hypothetical protein BGX27_001499 [Mortierella sp. AM989]|nr:hypothetical protein BGX27_001499 [Mortierella sp. AM989]